MVAVPVCPVQGLVNGIVVVSLTTWVVMVASAWAAPAAVSSNTVEVTSRAAALLSLLVRILMVDSCSGGGHLGPAVVAGFMAFLVSWSTSFLRGCGPASCETWVSTLPVRARSPPHGCPGAVVAAVGWARAPVK